MPLTVEVNKGERLSTGEFEALVLRVIVGVTEKDMAVVGDSVAEAVWVAIVDLVKSEVSEKEPDPVEETEGEEEELLVIKGVSEFVSDGEPEAVRDRAALLDVEGVED